MFIRILLADRLEMFRDLLRRILEREPDFVVVADTGNGEELARLVSEHSPDIILCELKLHRRSGVDALREVLAANPNLKAIVFTDSISKKESVQAILCGIRGIVTKDAPTALLLKSIRSVMAGQYWLSRSNIADIVPDLRSLVTAAEQGSLPDHRLSDQQRKIIDAIVAGCSNKDIAEDLAISQRTVKYHLTRLYEMYGVSGRMELARCFLNRKMDAAC